ncbi:AAA family ATPase [Virgibacillus halodenitrificans]|nr:AAA family ATPase [Virgibacillus halodenitrificans]
MKLIKEIVLKDVASYDQEGTKLTNLRKVNYLYGSNGSGKTTISEVIRRSSSYPSCQVVKTETDSKIYVYNRNFVEENFGQSDKIKGIFTLGQDQKDTLNSIKSLKDEIAKHTDKVTELYDALGVKKEERDANREEFKEKCWKLKAKYTQYFKEAFVGYGNSKEKLMNKFIEETKNATEVRSYEELTERSKTLFESSLVNEEPLQLIQFNVQLENSELLSKKIIGAKDVDIADLINKLNISDWVLKGFKHMENTEGVCPFCQQGLPEDLEGKLSRYFDQAYSDQINKLKVLFNKYKSYEEEITKQLKNLANTGSSYLDIQKVQDIIILIESKIRENLNLIEYKLREPSRSIELHDISSHINNVNNEIDQANKSIDEHNNLVNNAKKASRKLLEDIWRYLAEENKYNYDHFKKKDDGFFREIEGRERGIENKKKYKKKLEEEVSRLQGKVTNIEHSVGEINKRLKSFGFTNFKLDTAEEEGFYRIVRGNGEEVKDTLSEGEKTFITFLYFYNLLKGSTDSEDVTTSKIVVLDDPISSLDSNILFIVSNLIRDIIEGVKNNESEIKQSFILTHNIYFHKEVSFKKHKQSSKEETFWIVRKSNDKSFIQRYNENPIKSSYELLWDELKLLKDQSLITTQNVMRRILENYFTFFGGIDLNEVVNKFDYEDKSTCRSLLTWLHDGSHHINEDLFVERSTDIVDNYLLVFKEIFYKMGHASHYEMMMRDYDDEIIIDDDDITYAKEEIIEAELQAASTVNK